MSQYDFSIRDTKMQELMHYMPVAMLAKKIDRHNYTIWQYVAGKNCMPVNVAIQIARILNKSIESVCLAHDHDYKVAHKLPIEESAEASANLTTIDRNINL